MALKFNEGLAVGPVWLLGEVRLYGIGTYKDWDVASFTVHVSNNQAYLRVDCVLCV